MTARAALIDLDAAAGAPYRAPVAISLQDAVEVPRLLLQAAFAWALPPRAWPGVARWLGRLNASSHPRRSEDERANIEKVVQGVAGMPPSRDLVAGFYAGRYEERFQFLRAASGWEPTLRIHGAEHVQAARNAGRGIVLWAGNFALNDLVSKIAWCRLGLAVSHYTRPVHGLSKTRFGIAVLNRIRSAPEDRYLAERISAETNLAGAMGVLSQRLGQRGAVSLTVGNRGKKLVSAPFLGGRLVLATGAPFLSFASGAALLPTFTVRGSDGVIDVVVGPPLASTETTRDAHAADIIRQYAAALDPYVRRAPLQWRGWRYTAAAA